MEWVTFSQLTYGKWEKKTAGKIRYSPGGVEIRTDDKLLIDHFNMLREQQAVVSNLIALDHTYLLIGGKYKVDTAEGQKILLKSVIQADSQKFL